MISLALLSVRNTRAAPFVNSQWWGSRISGVVSLQYCSNISVVLAGIYSLIFSSNLQHLNTNAAIAGVKPSLLCKSLKFRALPRRCSHSNRQIFLCSDWKGPFLLLEEFHEQFSVLSHINLSFIGKRAYASLLH